MLTIIYKMRLKFATKSLFLLLAIYTVLRAVFLFFNRQSLLKFDISSLLQSFFSGLRFDISAILTINAFFLLCVFFVPQSLFRKPNYFYFLKWVFLFLNAPFVIANLIDCEYYKFTGNRMNLQVLFLRREAFHQLDQFFINYLAVAVVAVGFLLGLYYFFPKLNTTQIKIESWRRQAVKMIFSFVLLVPCLVFGIRGGFQPKPLQPIHAYSLSGVTDLGVLTLNSTFTILKTRKINTVKPVYYFADSKDVFKQLKPNQLSRKPAAHKPQNVVILVLESFGTEFWGAANNGKGFTPFLDSLATQGLFFKNNYANGRRSIDALPAILFGVPSFMNMPIVKTNYYANQWNGLGHIAKKNGIHVSFFHGTPKGTMYFDAISAMAGIDDYYPFESYPTATDFDGHWGIYDEPFLQFMVEKLNSHPQPFISTVFTISSHQPYQVPAQYRDTLPKGRMAIHQSVGYVDLALKKFFESAQKQSWYKDTLFIITGDHTQMSATEMIETQTGRYRVPMLFFHPSMDGLRGAPEKITQHVDILPSILDFMGIRNEPYLLFGRSVFDDSHEGEATFLSYYGVYWLVRKDYLLGFSEHEQTSVLYSMHEPSQSTAILNQEKIRQSMETRLKLYIQYYKNSLTENNMYSWFEE
ncbi:sulfatase-like hydrolase/transferase [bacterium]|nr:sulfatase-like hydrolase/transferase [bacterium]